ncbi:polysaccharide deacetylase family protein [Streptomyces atratus]|uniref:hypothetical protein n=1 Tax=Streptomyces atratus TaxID=1893 RepID=UPI003666E1BE
MAPSCRSGAGGASSVSLITPESLEQQLQGDIPVVAHMPQRADRRRLAVRRGDGGGNRYVDDLPPVMSDKHAHNSRGYVGPRQPEHDRRDRFDGVRRELDRAVLPITLHVRGGAE